MAQSVIIPTLNAVEDLPECLGQVGIGHPAQVIVVDAGSDDGTADLARELGASVLTCKPGRGGQLACGAQEATGDWLLFLHADSLLPENWATVVADHMHTGQGAAAFRLAFKSDAPMARLTAGWANLRSRVLGLPYGDQGLLIPRALYERVGGFPDIPLMEDVAMARRLGGRIRLLPATITTSATRYERDGWLRRGSRNLLLLARYLTGAEPEKLARDYRR